MLTGLAPALALVAGALVLRLRPKDFQETFDGGVLPRLVAAQRRPAIVACVSAAFGLAGTARSR
jgi:hypothetical protein